MKKLIILTVLLLAARAFGAEVEYVGEPKRWNPVDTSTVYTQHIIYAGKKITLAVRCGSGEVGILGKDLNEPSRLPYGEEVFARVCDGGGGTIEPKVKAEAEEKGQATEAKITSSISAGDLPAIRKRVATENKALSRKMDKGYLPDLPLLPAEDAAYKQLALNSPRVTNINDKGFVAECHYDRDTGVRRYVTCNLFFPGKYSVGQVPMRYVHHIESVALNVARSFKQGDPASFQIMALVNVEGDFSPVCSFIYDKEFDTLTPIYMSR